MKLFLLKKIVIVSVIAFILMETLFAAGPKIDFKLPQTKRKGIDLQAVYDDMPETVPAIVLLQTECTSCVPLGMVGAVSEEIKNQMILTSCFKPVSMGKWLDSRYAETKAGSVFQFVGDLGGERYSVNLKGICKSNVFKCGGHYVLHMAVYPFSNGGYPVSAVRVFKSAGDIPKVVQYCLLDVSRLFGSVPKARRKVAVAPFEVSCRTLVEQKSGEFDFIKTSFSVQEGIEVKESDDYFSRIFAYQAETTGLFNASQLSNLAGYARSDVSASSVQGYADYLVKGTVVLSNKMNVITVSLVKSDTGKTVWSSKYFTKRLDLQEIWKINSSFLCGIAGILYEPGEYVILDGLSASGRGFYMNGMFAAWDKMEAVPIPARQLVVNTGTMLESDIALDPSASYSKGNRDFFIYVNNGETKVFNGREGEYVWNLLEK